MTTTKQAQELETGDMFRIERQVDGRTISSRHLVVLEKTVSGVVTHVTCLDLEDNLVPLALPYYAPVTVL